MRLADLDVETKRVITVARSVVWRATPDNLGRLSEAVKSFEKKHEGEMTDNLIRALFAGVDDDDTAALGKR